MLKGFGFYESINCVSAEILYMPALTTEGINFYAGTKLS
jgi:hypothetical protein